MGSFTKLPIFFIYIPYFCPQKNSLKDEFYDLLQKGRFKNEGNILKCYILYC